VSDIKDEHIDGLLSELNAGKSLQFTKEARLYNDGVDRGIMLVKAYREGNGLFQIPLPSVSPPAVEAKGCGT
jgi:hypothetical protein